MKDSIPLIVTSPASPGTATDRSGGEAHGTVATTARKLANEIPIDAFSRHFVEVVEKVKVMVDHLKAGVGGYAVDEITIGLAVTAEGTIGIATAGVEASIEICLRQK